MAMENVFKKKNKSKSLLERRFGADKVLFTIVFIIFVIQALSLFLPVFWMLISSLKGRWEYDHGNPFAFPEKWEFDNYVQAFSMLSAGDTSFWGMIWNSIWYTVIVTGLGAFVPSVTGYVMSKYRFPGRHLIFTVAITCMVIPIVGNTASFMKLVAALGINDTPLFAVITSLGGFGGSFLVYYGFFNSVSWSYAEAAEIDGAGDFLVFFKIMLPQAMPILLTYSITGAITNWNEYNTMILYLPSYPTLASGLFEYQSNAVRGADYPVYYAGLLISMIPTITLFALFSNRVMTSISLGGLK